MAERDLVFLSYAHDDKKMVLKLFEGLKKRGLNAWFDKADLGPGKWKQQIMRKIPKSRYFIFCVSEASIKKTGDDKPGFCEYELQTAWEIASSQPGDSFTIIPVRLEECERGDLRLSTYQQYDLFKDFDAGLDRLSVHMGGISLKDAKAKDERTEEDKLIEGMAGEAEVAFYAGEYEKSLRLNEAIIILKPEVGAVWYNMGIVLDELRKYTEAIEAYGEALKIKPDDHEAWYNKGCSLFRRGMHKEATEAYDKALKLKPDLHQAWYNKGIAMADLGQHNEAIKAYEKSLKIKPDQHEPWFNKGVVQNKLGKPKQAIEAYCKALDLKPDLFQA